MRIEDLERGDYISYYGNEDCTGRIIGFGSDDEVVICPDGDDGWVASPEQQDMYGIANEDVDKCWYLGLNEVDKIISSASKYPRIKTQFLGGLCFK
jgi:hypothetical protein